MGTALHPAVIVAVRVKRKSRPAASIAGRKISVPINGQQFLMQWLDEQDEAEKQIIIDRLFKKSATTTRQ